MPLVRVDDAATQTAMWSRKVIGMDWRAAARAPKTSARSAATANDSRDSRWCEVHAPLSVFVCVSACIGVRACLGRMSRFIVADVRCVCVCVCVMHTCVCVLCVSVCVCV